MSNSPCVGICNLQNNICTGCLRTLNDIATWSGLDMSSCMDVVDQINRNISTHNCPSCKKPAYCGMEAGKSIETCWCYTIPKDINPIVDYGDKCLCRSCLCKGKEDGSDARRTDS